MRFHAHPRRLLLLPCLLALFGCTTPQPAPVQKTEPTVTATPPAPPPPAPPAPRPEPPPPPTAPPSPPVLTNGPWSGCAAEEASLAVVVAIRTNHFATERVGVHFIRPARATVYRLVLLKPEVAATLAQKEVPEACFSAFHLTGNTADPAAPKYSIRSTLKQIPVDPTRAVTLQLRVNSGDDLLEESVTLNGLGQTEFNRGPIAARIEIVQAETALNRLPSVDEPANTASNPTPTDWDLLHKKFQLTGRESHVDGWLQLSGEASVQFPDIRFACEQIQFNEEHSLMKLRGPVRIEWDGRAMTSGDAVIRVSPGLIQFESASIQTN